MERPRGHLNYLLVRMQGNEIPIHLPVILKENRAHRQNERDIRPTYEYALISDWRLHAHGKSGPQEMVL